MRTTELAIFLESLYAGRTAEFQFALDNTGRMPSPQRHWYAYTEAGLAAEGDTLVPPLDRAVVAVVRAGERVFVRRIARVR